VFRTKGVENIKTHI